MTKRECKDCPPHRGRSAPHPGPRCYTHHKMVQRARRSAAHGAHILKTYGITSEQYEVLYEAQGGFCFICQRANGKTKKLSVDHDHVTGHVRGLLCTPCNKMLGHLRDDEAAFRRAGYYLRQPPAHRAIGKVKPDEAD